MSSISIDDNVTQMTEALDQMRGQLTGQERQLYRLEGMLSVFRNLKELGVVSIPVDQSKLKNIPENEVIDEAPVVSA
jgi:hypothetical protein